MSTESKDTRESDTRPIYICNYPKAGWMITWPSGFQSAMPNEKAAKLCHAAADLLEALRDMCNAYAGTGAQSSAEESLKAYDRAKAIVYALEN